MHSVSDLTTFSRKARGDVPPPLVGASTTVIDSQMYLFGGRLVAQRRMVADLYRFHLAEHTWERLPAPETDPNAPPPRYFHSADVWNGHLVIFGGMGYASSPNTPDDLCVLSDVRLYSLADGCWLPAPPSSAPATALGPDSELDPTLASSLNSDLAPRARYAHLSAVSANHLYIIGGQDMTNAWLDDIHVFDLVARTWVARVPYPRHCGTYRSVAVCAPERVVNPPRVFANIQDDSPGNQEELVELPFTADATPECPNNIYLYSNHNFTDVKRELQTLHPTPTIPDSPFSLTDASALLTGSSLPPGLRFPTGALLGTHLLIAGTYLAHTFQSYSLWALDLRTYTWSRIDPGTALSRGAWGRGVVWGSGGRFVVFGNGEGNLVEDYNRRLLSWGDVAYVDLEAFGVYSPPRRMFAAPTPPIPAPDAPINTSGEDPTQLSALAPVILGLKTLHQHNLADFEVVADDGRRIKCSSAVLEARWGWFRRQRQLFRKRAQKIEAELARDGVRGRSGSRGANGDREASSTQDQDERAGDSDFVDLDPRLTSRELLLSEPYAVTLALLQYFYTLTLTTPLQHAPPVLSALLLIACTYTEEQTPDAQETEESRLVNARPRQANGNGNGHVHIHSPASSPFSGSSNFSSSPQPRLPQFDALPHLTSLVRHAMHRALSTTNSVGVYEVATLCDCQSLQIRALKVVMASSKKQVHKQRQHGSGSGPSGRPRGMSDAPPPPPNGRPRTAEGTRGTTAGGNNIPASAARQKRLHTADGTRPRKPLVETYSHAPMGPAPSFGPVPKHTPPSEPIQTNDPFESVSRRGYRRVLDAVGDGIYSEDGHLSDMHYAPPRSISRGHDSSRSDSRSELRLHSQTSHAALRETHARHRPALDGHGNPMGVDLEQRKEQIVRRWSKRISMDDSDEQQHLGQQQSHLNAELDRPRSRTNYEASTSPSRAQRTLATSPSFTGGASLATVPSYSSASSGRPGSTSSGGSGPIRTPTDQTSQFHAQSRGHHPQGSESTLRPATQETRRVMVGMSPYGVPIYREVRQDEPEPIPGLAGTQGKQKGKDKGASGGKSEGGGGLGWLLSPQAKAEKAAAKVQAKLEKRAREAAEREAAALEETERRKNKEEMQQRIANIRNPVNDRQAEELSKISAYQFAFVGNM
ncbi:Rab9 effector protein with kelch motifs [Ceratobasidium sp. AG-Ba]|nr:Rab9 effector protein with kelch motifs [Ceratobasidium sp. AG-Ba]